MESSGTKGQPAVVPDPPRLHPDAYQGPAAEIVRALEPHTEADPDGILLQLLVGLGNAVGPVPHLRAEGRPERANLYVVLVGNNHGARLHHGWSHTCRVFREVAGDWARACIVTRRAKTLCKSPAGFAAAMPRAADRRLLSFEPRFAALLAGAARGGGGGP
jgi:hypothetical protein